MFGINEREFMNSVLLDQFSIALICVVCAIPIIYVLLYIMILSLSGMIKELLIYMDLIKRGLAQQP